MAGKVVCPNCGTLWEAPPAGADLRNYYCSACGYPHLQPVPVTPPETRSNDHIIGGVAGAAVGASIAGPTGAVIGFLGGFIVGLARRQARHQ